MRSSGSEKEKALLSSVPAQARIPTVLQHRAVPNANYLAGIANLIRLIYHSLPKRITIRSDGYIGSIRAKGWGERTPPIRIRRRGIFFAPARKTHRRKSTFSQTDTIGGEPHPFVTAIAS